MKRAYDDTQKYLERLRPLYVRLFRAAHAIVGNLEVAEYVLRSAIVEAFLRQGEWRDRMSFADGLMHTVRAVALVELKGVRQAGSFETDWTMPSGGEEDSPTRAALYERLTRESETTQRVAVLYFGCGMAVKQIAVVLQIRPGEAAGRLRRLTSRLLRSVGLGGRNARGLLEDHMEKLVLSMMSTPGGDVAEMGKVFRSFERDVDGAKRPRASTARVVGLALKIGGACALAFLFWLMAVLVQPGQTPPQQIQDHLEERNENG